MANLFPTANNIMTVPLDNLKQNTPVGYKRSLKFDYDTGDFVRDGQHRLISASGVEAFKQWCENCISTDRYAYSSYSTDFGINLDLIMALPDKAAQEIMLKKERTEAIMADDYKRAKSVDDFSFNWIDTDAVEVECTVTDIDNAEIDIKATVGG